MIFAYKSLEYGWSNSILVKFFLGFLFFCHFISDHFLSKLFLRIFARGKSIAELADLALETVRGEFLAVEKMVLSTFDVLFLEILLGEENLHH